MIYNNLYKIKVDFISQHHDIGFNTLKPSLFLAEITRFTSGLFYLKTKVHHDSPVIVSSS